MSLPRKEVIVVGSGLGGLTAAALLAKGGLEVLVLEKEAITGGYAAGFDWKERRFDSSVHLIMGGGAPSTAGHGIVTDVLQRLGVASQCDFARLDPFYRAVFPDLDLVVSGGGREGFVSSFERHFPGEAAALKQLLEDCAAIHRATLRFPIAPNSWQKLLVPVRFLTLFRNHRLTLDEALQRYGFDSDAKAALGSLWLYLGLPPSRVSFLVWATMTASMVEEGAFYCLGGFQRLADALRSGVELHGGEVRTGAPVRKILVRHGKVRGVEVGDGDIIRAPIVVSNVDARATIHEMIGGEHIPDDFRDRVTGLRPSISVVALYTSLPYDLVPVGTVHETIVFASGDHDLAYENGLSGRVATVTVTIPTITDTSVAVENEHLVVLKGMIPGEAGPVPDDAVAQLTRCAAPVLPKIADYLGVGPDAVAGDPDRYALKTLGPIYGWERSPDQAGPRGLGNTTPIRGLYLCGHWSQPGGGIRTVIISGMRVARLITGEQASKGLIR